MCKKSESDSCCCVVVVVVMVLSRTRWVLLVVWCLPHGATTRQTVLGGREAAPAPPPPAAPLLPPFSAFPQSEPGRAGMWSLVIVILQPSNLTHHLHHTHQENQQASDVLAETPCRSRDSNCAAHYKSVSQCELPTPSGISSLSSLPPTNLFSLFLLCSL